MGSRDRLPLGRRSGQADEGGTAGWDLPTAVGRTTLRNPVMPASGTYGYGLEYAAYGDPRHLGALVVKSLSASPWDGNPPPRLAPVSAGTMLNSIGLPNPGVEAWARDTLPLLLGHGVTVVASIWGHTPGELLDAAKLMAESDGPVAWEINMSCPNLATSNEQPAQNPQVAREIVTEVRALADDAVGLWPKLAPHAPDVPAVAAACHQAGADAVTLTNTFPAKALQTSNENSSAEPLAMPSGDELPRLGGQGGGISGAALRPIVRQIVADVRQRSPDLPIVAAGGILTADDALDYLALGAQAVQVGTANFLDPRATHTIAHAVVSRLAGDRR